MERIRDLIVQIFQIGLYFARQLLRQYYFKKCPDTGFAGMSGPEMTLGAKPSFSFNFIKYGHVVPCWKHNDELITNEKRTMD